jgi:hypothetical protein
MINTVSILQYYYSSNIIITTTTTVIIIIKGIFSFSFILIHVSGN